MKPELLSPLSSEFKPPTLLYRTKQLHELLELAQAPWPVNVWIQGDQGLGKTLTAKIFADEIDAQKLGRCYYIEWQISVKKTFQIVNDIYHLDLSKQDYEPYAFSQAVIRLTDSKERIFLIMDEPMKAKHWQLVDAATYSLYQRFLGQRALSLILISRLGFNLVKRYFQPDTLSRLQLRPIIFPVYGVDEIVEILKQRLNYTMEAELYDIEALVDLANHIRNVGGDMRQAIEILRYAVLNAGARLSKMTMTEAIEWGKNKWWGNELTSLPPQFSLLSYIAAQEIENSDGVTTAQDVKQRYNKIISEMNLKPLGNRTIYYILEVLFKKGFLTFTTEGMGKNRRIWIAMDEGDRKHIIKAGGTIDWNLQFPVESPEKPDAQTTLQPQRINGVYISQPH